MQGFQDFFHRGSRIKAMDLVKINVVHLEPPKAVVNGVEDVFAGESALVRVIAHRVGDLGGHDQPVARRPEVLERASQYFFADAERIHVRGIEEVDAGFEGLADERTALRLIQHPLAPFPGTVGHAAQANPRNLYPARTKIDIFHSISS